VIEQPSSHVIASLKQHGLRLVGTHSTDGIDYHRCDLRRPSAILVGGEGAGLPPAVRAKLDDTVRVPMRRGVESLSVNAAAAVVLFEAARQRGGPSETDQPFDL
jgi:tRNA G18 (ribose-2'-O)-methylase SpoU